MCGKARPAARLPASPDPLAALPAELGSTTISSPHAAAVAQEPREQQQILLTGGFTFSTASGILHNRVHMHLCLPIICLPTACLTMSVTGHSRAETLPPTIHHGGKHRQQHGQPPF